jgi:hypothetical protein
MSARRAFAAVALSALVPFLAACGGGSKNAAKPLPTAPTLTVPGESKTPTITKSTGGDTSVGTTTSTAVTTTPTQTTTAPANPSAPSGGAVAPQTGGATPDTQQSDQAPPANSPASKFEQFCKDNPGAC